MVIPLKKVTELHKRLFQSEAECEATDMKTILVLYSYASKTLAWDHAMRWGKKRKRKKNSASDSLGRRNATQNSSASLKRCFLFASLSHHWLYKLTLFVQNCFCKEFPFVYHQTSLHSYVKLLLRYSLDNGIAMTSKRRVFTLSFTGFKFQFDV